MVKLKRLLLVLFIICFKDMCIAETGEFIFSDGVLRISTPRFKVTWENGVITSAKNLTGNKCVMITNESRPMSNDVVPTGLGSIYENEAAAKAQHGSWIKGSLNRQFPAQHPPDKESSIVSFERLPNGARLTYQGLKEDSSAQMIEEFYIDDETGDLIIKQEAASDNPGVFGVAFGILNLRQEIELAVPYFGGQTWGDYLPKGNWTIAWPYMWSASIIIGMTPEGGNFAVWAEDPQMKPKYFHWYNGADGQALSFQANEEEPYQDNHNAKSTIWRFNTFPDSWVEPAERYKSAIKGLFDLTPLKERSPAWAEELSLVINKGIGSLTVTDLELFSELVSPEKALIKDWSWLDGFNKAVPTYEAKLPAFPQWARLAADYGFHRGVFTSLGLIDENVHPTMVDDYDLEYLYNGPYNKKPTQETAKKAGPVTYIHPGSKKWRSFYTDTMVEVHEKYYVDNLYQDVAGCAHGSSGILEGLNYSQAWVEGARKIKEELPYVSISGEMWNETVVFMEADFGIQCFTLWGRDEDRERLVKYTHPILSYIFGDFTRYWDYNVTIRDVGRFHDMQSNSEVIGALPVWDGLSNDRQSEAMIVKARAQLWEEGFRPYFPSNWDPQIAAYMKDDQDRIVKYYRPQGLDGSSYCLEETSTGDKLRYARVTKTKTVQGGEIHSWVAYDDNGPIGLNPDKWYCVFPTEPDSEFKVTSLPENMFIDGTRFNNEYCLLEIGGSGSGQLEWESSKQILAIWVNGIKHTSDVNPITVTAPTEVIFEFAKPLVINSTTDLYLDQWQQNYISSDLIFGSGKLRDIGNYTIDNRQYYGYTAYPPAGGAGSEYSIDKLLALPADKEITLSFHTGLRWSGGDGVHFIIKVNGQEMYKRFRETQPGWEYVEIDLSEYAGQDIVLSFAVDCGPISSRNTSNDFCIWGVSRLSIY